MNQSIDFSDIEKTIDQEVAAQSNTANHFDRSKLPSTKLLFPKPETKFLSKQTIHGLLHMGYKIPVIGYLLNLGIAILRLPRSQAKFRNELLQLQNELDRLEIAVANAKLETIVEVEKHLTPLRGQVAQMRERAK